MIISEELIFEKNKGTFPYNLFKNRKNKQNHSNIFVYEPERLEEKNLGSLYIIMEILGVPADSGHIINLITSAIKREYYLKTYREPLASLEAGLKKANSLIVELAHKTESDKLGWISKLNCVCASIYQNTIYLTKTGKFKALLFRNDKLINIDQKLDETPNENNISKTFHGIISGNIEQNDKIIFLPTRTLDIITINKLEDIYRKNATQKIREQINKILLDPEFPHGSATILLMDVIEDPISENCENSEYITPPIDLKEIITI